MSRAVHGGLKELLPSSKRQNQIYHKFVSRLVFIVDVWPLSKDLLDNGLALVLLTVSIKTRKALVDFGLSVGSSFRLYCAYAMVRSLI